MIKQGVSQLKQITDKLKRAYNGDNVDWSDDGKQSLFVTQSEPLETLREVHGGDQEQLNVSFIQVETRRARLVLGWVNIRGKMCTANPNPFVGVDLTLC